MKDDKPVITVCYGHRRLWATRREAIDFFSQGILSCDGSERDRYVNIVMDLLEGREIATDDLP